MHSQGSSGGPMFVQGKVVGVVSGTDSDFFGNFPTSGPIKSKVAPLKLNKNLADEFLLKGTP